MRTNKAFLIAAVLLTGTAWGGLSPLYVKERVISQLFPVGAVAFSSDDRRIATATSYKIRIYEIQNGREVLTIQLRGGNSFSAMSFGLNDSVLYVVENSYQPKLRVFDTWSGKERGQMPLGHLGILVDADFSGDGEYLITGGYHAKQGKPKPIRVWRTRDWKLAKPEAEIIIKDTFSNRPISISYDGRWIVSGASKSKLIRVFDRTALPKPVMEVVGPTRARQLRLSRDNKKLLFLSSYDARYQSWDVASARPHSSSHLSGRWDVQHGVFVPGEKFVLVSMASGTIRVRDRLTGAESHFPLIEHTQRTSQMLISHNERLLATAAGRKAVIWRLK